MSGESTREWAARLPTQPRRSTRTAGEREHSSEDLSHVRVTHKELSEIPLGHSEILVLDDQLVGEEETDALVSIERKEIEATEKRTAAKQRKRQYNPYEDEEEGKVLPSGLKKKSLLRKYDEEDDENEKKSTKEADTASAPTEATLIELKKRNVRRKVASFTDEPAPLAFTTSNFDESKPLALDDDDLQRSLAKNRRQNVKSFNIEDVGEEAPLKIEGIVFSESTDFFISTKQPLPMVLDTTEILPKVKETEPTLALSNVPDKIMPFEREPLIRRGLCATLEYLAKIGMRPQLTNEAIPPQQRPRAARFADIKIEHHDEEGNLLTPKEAYKLLSHKFHGKTPGKSKLEKIRRKKELAKKMQSSNLGDTPLGTAAALRERHKATGSTHVVLQKGGHAVEPEAGKDTTKVAKPKSDPKKPVEKRPRIFGMK